MPNPIGLGENTDLIADGEECEVVGEGVAMVLDPGHLAYSDRPGRKEGRPSRSTASSSTPSRAGADST